MKKKTLKITALVVLILSLLAACATQLKNKETDSEVKNTTTLDDTKNVEKENDKNTKNTEDAKAGETSEGEASITGTTGDIEKDEPAQNNDDEAGKITDEKIKKAVDKTVDALMEGDTPEKVMAKINDSKSAEKVKEAITKIKETAKDPETREKAEKALATIKVKVEEITKKENLAKVEKQIVEIKDKIVDEVKNTTTSDKVVNNTDKSTSKPADKSTSKPADKSTANTTTTKTITETKLLRFGEVTKNDPALLKGKTRVTDGVKGELLVTIKVTYKNGTEINREVVGTKVIKLPVDKVTYIGTKTSTSSTGGSNTTKPVVEDKIVKKTTTNTETIPYKTIYKDDNTLTAGTTKISRSGVNGTRTIVKELTYTNGKLTNTKTISNKVTKQPIDKIVLRGTKPKTTVTTKTITETQSIPFKTIKKNDSSLKSGTTKVSVTGQNGTKALTYKITYTNGKQTNKQLVSTKITKQPVNKVVLVGTKKTKVWVVDKPAWEEWVEDKTKPIYDYKYVYRVYDFGHVSDPQTYVRIDKQTALRHFDFDTQSAANKKMNSLAEAGHRSEWAEPEIKVATGKYEKKLVKHPEEGHWEYR